MVSKSRRRAVAALAVLLSIGAGGGAAMFLFDRGPDAGRQTDAAADDSSPTSTATPDGGPSVLVFLKLRDATAYERASYVGVDRPAPHHADNVVAKLRAAMSQLVKGPTPQERDQGLSSVFSPQTSGLAESVDVDESGAATVSFRDFREQLPEVSTSEGGTILMQQLNHTVFQFQSVDRVVYQIEGHCATFWEFLQAGRCIVVPRSGFQSD